MIVTTTILALADKEIQAATVPPITFVVTALLVIAVILLGVDLVRRIRRAQFREEIQQDLAAEIAERDANDALVADTDADADADAAPDVDAGPEADATPNADAGISGGKTNRTDGSTTPGDSQTEA